MRLTILALTLMMVGCSYGQTDGCGGPRVIRCNGDNIAVKIVTECGTGDWGCVQRATGDVYMSGPPLAKHAITARHHQTPHARHIRKVGR